MTSTSKATIVPAMFALALLATATSKASAEDWCRINEHDLLSCGFATKEQCQAMTSGRTGYCDHNPFPGKTAAVHHPVVVSTSAEYAVCQSMKLDCVGPSSTGSRAYAYLPKSAHAKHHAK